MGGVPVSDMPVRGAPVMDVTSGTVLAFDFGEKRIGVAVGELSLRLAHPLAVIGSESNDVRFAEIAILIQEWSPVLLVVGLPAHMDGTEHELSRLCRRFAQRLEGRFKIDTVLVDERLSSAEAESALAEAGVTGKKRKPLLDQVAAQRILQTFFHSGLIAL